MTATQESPTPGQTLIGALVGMIEHHFAQRIIDATWRLNRATPPEPQTVPATDTEKS